MDCTLKVPSSYAKEKNNKHSWCNLFSLDGMVGPFLALLRQRLNTLKKLKKWISTQRSLYNQDEFKGSLAQLRARKIKASPPAVNPYPNPMYGQELFNMFKNTIGTDQYVSTLDELCELLRLAVNNVDSVQRSANPLAGLKQLCTRKWLQSTLNLTGKVMLYYVFYLNYTAHRSAGAGQCNQEDAQRSILTWYQSIEFESVIRTLGTLFESNSTMSLDISGLEDMYHVACRKAVPTCTQAACSKRTLPCTCAELQAPTHELTWATT